LNEDIAFVFSTFLNLLIFALIGRALLSWFPNAQNNQFGRMLHMITEPILEPIRRFMPRTGMMDFSTMVAIVVIYVMIMVINQAAAA
jgi:YggT family protein